MAIGIHKFAVVILTFLTGCFSDEPTKCGKIQVKSKLSSKLIETEATESAIVEYYCPRENDPDSYTVCCEDGCCEPPFLSMPMNDDRLLMLTATSIICSCGFLIIMFIICCFWSKCPMYNSCRSNYNGNSVVVYSLEKDDPTPLMPAETNGGGQYYPCTVKIRKMQEV